ncbi:MAG: hypothetical protein K6G81_08350 [Lachnospiraceae bacterium]|nr:hypothetical protein [Lachnospiraceae bacterium]
MRIARAALHYWEEPCISGTKGSGAVFFTGCNLKCVYCQNAAISEGNAAYGNGGDGSGYGIDDPICHRYMSEEKQEITDNNSESTEEREAAGAGSGNAEERESAGAGSIIGHRPGKEVTPRQLVDIFFRLKGEGAHNINLVTPSHFVPQIRRAVILAKDEGFDLPFVYNSSAYESVETLKMLEGLIDVYLPDFKYMDVKKSAAYSHAPDYPEAAKAAIAEMFRQVGEPVFEPDSSPCAAVPRSMDNGSSFGNGKNTGEQEVMKDMYSAGTTFSGNVDNGSSFGNGRNTGEQEVMKDMYYAGTTFSGNMDNGSSFGNGEGTYEQGSMLIKKGVIVRHLVLPLGVKNACDVIDYLAATYGDSIYISVMSQYTPLAEVPGALTETQKRHLTPFPELARRVTKREYERVIAHCCDLGLTNVYIQEGDVARESFIPAWDM